MLGKGRRMRRDEGKGERKVASGDGRPWKKRKNAGQNIMAFHA